ncbi:MAG: hypothetical protein JWM34_451 [Ilumatobacteraceae bacterium]|nr:hypothetical protein [Ilumatobacteraceae bacterium]
MNTDRHTRSRASLGLIAAATLALIAAGCSSDKQAAPTTTVKATTTTAAATTAPTKATTAQTTSTGATVDTTATTDTAATDTVTSDTTSDTTTDTTAATDGVTVGSDVTIGSGVTTGTDGVDDTTIPVWERTAVVHRGQNGKQYTIDCTPNGTLGTIWGTETYTDDSSICTAAVHVGLITVDTGGKVTYEIAAGADSYAGMDGNGVTSNAYGSWGGSYTFPAAKPAAGTFTPSVSTWDQNAASAAIGDTLVVDCSTGGHIGTVWGTGTYTSDSSICTAAVLEGLITVDKGGIVVVDVTKGEDSYQGSTKNGVTSNDYAQWGLSYVFPKDQTPPAKSTTASTTDNSTPAT